MTKVNDLQSKRKTKSIRLKTWMSKKHPLCFVTRYFKSVAWHDTKTLHGAGKRRWSKSINVPFFPKSFDWFTMQSKVQKNALDSRTRTSRRFDCPFLAKILRLMLLFVGSTGCSVILVAGNWAFCWSKNATYETATVFMACFETTTFLQNLVLKWRRYHVFPTKMTLVCTRSMLF